MKILKAFESKTWEGFKIYFAFTINIRILFKSVLIRSPYNIIFYLSRMLTEREDRLQ